MEEWCDLIAGLRVPPQSTVESRLKGVGRGIGVGGGGDGKQGALLGSNGYNPARVDGESLWKS